MVHYVFHKILRLGPTRLSCYIQSVREICAIIVTDGYLCYKEPKSPYNFILILIFNESFTFKTGRMATFKDGEIYSGLEGHQPFVYVVTQIPLLSLQCCRDFQIRKLACNAI